MKFWQVDSFTDLAFAGNPAVVIVLSRDISDELKQNIAMEMNVSETAFISKRNQEMEIRWFTPNSEVNLCGHATLAAGHILWTEGFVKTNNIELKSKSGPLGVRKNDDVYTLDFPSQPPVEKSEYTDLIQAIVNCKPLYIGSNGQDCSVELPSADIVRKININLEKVKELPERGLLLTARDDTGKFDYIYRAFFPKLNVPEDPVTGSANTLLAPYWANKLGKLSLTAYQASKRGGRLTLEVESDRVLISGKAKTVIVGELTY
jgi:PhzF family phenazine biosynthesis protein